MKEMYIQRNSVGTDRENIFPGNFQKELHHCLTTLRVLNTEKRTPSLSYDV